MGLAYRLQQFRYNLLARELSPSAKQLAHGILRLAERPLFAQYDVSDQWHTVRVVQMLQAAGHTHPHLLTAALLHDVGKTRVDLTVWERSLAVLIQKLWPQKADQWGQGAAAGWKRPFVVRQQHAAWGAEMATAVGCHPQVVELIARHQDKLEAIKSETDHLLAQLQWADDRC